jgi:hypothetical protein
MIATIYAMPNAGTPLHSVVEATLETGKGLVGDRYYEGGGTFSEKLRNSSDWEITLIELEEVERFNQLEKLALPAGDFRRNIVTRGARLNELVGSLSTVGSALLEGMRLCEPRKNRSERSRPPRRSGRDTARLIRWPATCCHTADMSPIHSGNLDCSDEP